MLFFYLIANKRETQVEEKAPKEFKPIVIKEIFTAKSPKLAKVIPGFVYRYITRLLQLDFLNDLLKRNNHLKGIDFIDQVVADFNVTEQLYGYENVPESGRYIFASNHPLGGFDALLIMKFIDKKLGKLKFLTNDILMGIPSLSPMFVPVNKHGGHSREAAKALLEVYNSDQQVVLFPSGLASRKIKGKIVDLEWKKHFISKAIKHKRDVIPIFIEGRNSNRFYRTANFRKFFHIKWNLEMFFLPDETVKHRNTNIPIYFGEPIPYTTFDKSKTHQEWANWVKEVCYKLPENYKGTN